MIIRKVRNEIRYGVRSSYGCATYGTVKYFRTWSRSLENIPDDTWMVIRNSDSAGSYTLCDSMEEARSIAIAEIAELESKTA